MRNSHADPPPLKPDVFWILTALAKDSNHGYAILRQVEALSSGQLVLRPGPLYRRLAKLLQDGWIAEHNEDHQEPSVSEARRRVYRITKRGRKVAAAEVARMSQAVISAEAVGLRSGP